MRADRYHDHSDDEITAALGTQYSKQILALPEGSQRIWLFSTPPAIAVAGLVTVSLRIKRLMAESGAPELTKLPTASLGAGWDDY